MQRADFAEVVRLGDEAREMGIHPVDWVEWMPFLEAYAYLGELGKAGAILPILKSSQFIPHQVCEFLEGEPQLELTDAQLEGQRYLMNELCS